MKSILKSVKQSNQDYPYGLCTDLGTQGDLDTSYVSWVSQVHFNCWAPLPLPARRSIRGPALAKKRGITSGNNWLVPETTAGPSSWAVRGHCGVQPPCGGWPRFSHGRYKTPDIVLLAGTICFSLNWWWARCTSWYRGRAIGLEGGGGPIEVEGHHCELVEPCRGGESRFLLTGLVQGDLLVILG